MMTQWKIQGIHSSNSSYLSFYNFLGIKIAQSNSDVVISQRKYTFDILEETCMLDSKPVDTPMDLNVKLVRTITL